MGKMFTYLILMVGLTALFYFTGLTIDCLDSDGNECTTHEECMCQAGIDPSSSTLNLIFNIEKWEDKEFLSKAVLIFTGITALGISFIAAVALRDARLALVGPFTLFLLESVFFGFISIIIKVKSIHPALSVLTALIAAPLFIGFIPTLIDWWGGTD